MKDFRSHTLYAILIAVLAVFGIVATLSAGTTGKLVGYVMDAGSGDKLLGANILIEGTTLGGSADASGFFLVLNISPGVYTLRCSMMGYETLRKTEIEVVADRTTTVNFKLKQTAIQGQEVVVRGERAIVPMDVSSSEMVVTPEKITQSMFHDVQSVIGAQMGIQAFGALAQRPQIRGSDMNESAMVMDGMVVVDNMTSRPLLKVNLNSVQEIKVITGGFNAEYGNVRSGVVNVVTKEGGKRYSGTLDVDYSPPGLKHFGPDMYGKDSPIVIPFTDFSKGAMDGVGNPFYSQGWKGWNDYAKNVLKAGQPNYNKPYDCLAKYLWQHRSLDNLNMLRQLAKDGLIQADLSRISDDDAIFAYGDKPDYTGEAAFGGPVPFTKNKVRFFLSTRLESKKMAMKIPLDYFGQFSTLKLSSQLTRNIKLNVNFIYNMDEGPSTGGQGAGVTDIINSNPFTTVTGGGADGDLYNQISDINKIWYPHCMVPARSKNWVGGFSLNHVLSPKTFYEITFQEMYTRPEMLSRFRNTAPIKGNLYGCTSSAAPTLPLGLGILGTEANLAQWSNIADAANYKYGFENWQNWAKVKIGDYWYDEAPWGYGPVNWRDETGEYRMESCVLRDNQSSTRTYQLRMALTSQINKHNQVKAGIDLNHDRFVAYYTEIDPSINGGTAYNSPFVKPWRGAAYVQDKLEFEGMIANLGLRFDWEYRDKMLSADGPVGDKVTGPYTVYYQAGKTDTMWSKVPLKKFFKYYFSPRVGISHPISDKAKIFFNYAHMVEWPDLYTQYRYQRSTVNGYRIDWIGNPTLDPPRTITYEVGYSQSILNAVELKATGYYKDVNGEYGDFRYNYINGYAYQTRVPAAYRDIRGVEVSADMRYGRFVSGTATLNYMVTSRGNYGYRDVYEDPNKQSAYVASGVTQPYARPWIKLLVDFHTPPQFGPRVGKLHPIADMNLNVYFNWRDGDKFTWNPLGIPSVLDNIKWRSYKRIDIRFTKQLFKAWGVEPVFYMDVYNVFNFKNMIPPASYTYGTNNVMTGTGTSGQWEAHKWWKTEFLNYLNSLDLKEQLDGSIVGPDRPGDYPENWPNQAAEGGKRSYIKMPGFTSYTFLEPRDVWFGIRINF
jgi:outer membrane receptor protein involved in Fe transport